MGGGGVLALLRGVRVMAATGRSDARVRWAETRFGGRGIYLLLVLVVLPRDKIDD